MNLMADEEHCEEDSSTINEDIIRKKRITKESQAKKVQTNSRRKKTH